MEVHKQDPPRLKIKEEIVDLEEDESMDDEAGPSTRISNLPKRDSIAGPALQQLMSESEVKKEVAAVDDDTSDTDYMHPGLAKMEMVWVYEEKPTVGNQPNSNTSEEDGDITLQEMEDLEERENLPQDPGSSAQIPPNIVKYDETTNKPFDNFETNFKRQQSNAHRLHKEMANYLRCSRALHSASRSLFNTLGEVYEREWVGYDHLCAQAQNSDVLWTDLCDKIQDQTLEPLKAYVNQFPYVKKRIVRRGQKLLDYDSQRHQLEELQKATEQDEYKIARARDTVDTAKTSFEELNKELYAELPIFYEQRISKVASNLQTLCAAETVFMTETIKVRQTLEAIADKLVTEYAKGSYMTQRMATPTITNREAIGGPYEEIQFEETSINGTTTTATACGDSTEIHPDTEQLNNQEYHDDSSREQSSVPGPGVTKHRVHKVKKTFKCDHCEERFSKRSDLILHGPTHTGEKPFKCDQCQKCFNHRPSLTRHMRTHTDEKPYKCDHCEECFSLRSDLINHIQTHTDEKPYKCKDCENCFVLHSQLVAHMRTHNAEKPHMCNHCGKCFGHRMNLEVHMRTHTGEKPFKCEHCERCFSQRASLMKHMRAHTGEKPYKCKHCEKCFRRPETLVEHMRTHTGEKSFMCNQCGKCFRQRSHLVIHMRIHTGEKPFKCDHCGKCFSESGRLVVHMRTHTGEKPFKCDTCGKCYSQSSQLVVHVLTHTGEKPFMCDTCGKCYSQSSQLAGHVRTHTGEKPHKCNHCERCFNYHGDLIKHIRTHTGEKPFKCDHCGKCFSQSSHLVGHMRTHTGDKPFKCDHCESSFSDSSNLTKHIQSHTADKLYQCVYCEKYFASGANLSKHLLVHKKALDTCDEDGMPFQTTEDI